MDLISGLQVAEGTGLTPNLLHLNDVLIPCFHFKSKGDSAAV